MPGQLLQFSIADAYLLQLQVITPIIVDLREQTEVQQTTTGGKKNERHKESNEE